MLFRQSVGLLKGACAALAVVGSLNVGVVEAAPGDHLRAGNLVVTPSIRAGLQYRSNAFRQPNDPAGSLLGMIIPQVQAELDSPDLRLGLGANYGIQKYLVLANTPEDIRSQRVQALDRFNNFGLNATADIAPTGAVGLGLRGTSRLNNNPSNIDLDSDDPYTTSFNNEAGATLDIRPGPALLIAPGFRYGWTQFFVPEDDARRDPFNARERYGPTLNASWQFLPRTQLVFASNVTLNRWADNNPEIAGAAIAVNDSTLGQAVIGVQGRVTERLKLIAQIGSGFGSFRNSSALGATDGLIAVLSGSYDVSDLHTIDAGFRKSFFDSFFTNSVSVVSLTAGWNGRYADEKVTSSLNIGTRFENYDGPLTRNDQVTTINANVGYNINPWARATLGGGWLQRASRDNPVVEFDDVNVTAMMILTY